MLTQIIEEERKERERKREKERENERENERKRERERERQQEKELLKSVGAFIKVNYIDPERKIFIEIEKIALLVDSYLAITPSHYLSTDVLSNETMQFLFFPVRESDWNLTSSSYLSQRFNKCTRKTDINSNFANVPVHETSWGIIPLNNIMGEVLLESNKIQTQYYSLYPLDKYIEENKNNARFRMLIIDPPEVIEKQSENEGIENKEKEKKVNEPEKKKNDSTVPTFTSPYNKKNLKLLSLYSKYYFDQETKKYYFFLDEEGQRCSFKGEGFLLSGKVQISGVFKPNNTMTIKEFSNKFSKNLSNLKDLISKIKTVLIIEQISEKDVNDFKTTINFFHNELSTDVGKMSYSHNDYEDVVKYVFNSIKEDDSNLFWKSFLLGGENFIKRMSCLGRPGVFGFDQDLMVRKIYNLKRSDISIGELNMNNINYSSSKYFNTILKGIIFNNADIITLNLNGTKLNYENVLNLSLVIYYGKNLKNIVLSRNNFDYKSLYILTIAMKENKAKSIEFIDLSYNNFSKLSTKAQEKTKMIFFSGKKKENDQDDQFYYKDLSFLSELIFVPGLKKLRLDHIENFAVSKNFNKKENVDGMISFLEKSSSILETDISIGLEVIDLSAFELSSSEVMYPFSQFISHLCRNSLKHLILQGCSINDETFEILSDFFVKEEILLNFFDISSNNLTESSAQSINNFFKTVSTKMKKTQESGENFYYSFANNKELNYHKSHTIKKGLMYEEIKFCKKTHLDLSNTSVDTETLQALTNIFDTNEGLNIFSLNISNNDIKDRMIIDSKFGQIVAQNKNLRCLIVNHNEITARGIGEMFDKKENSCVVICDVMRDIDWEFLRWIKFVGKKEKKTKKTKSRKNIF